ncbi:amidohydrolase family protein [Sphingobium sp. CR2-8]|uniref:N-acyl-D-amino-acid deacylase family protein n=1 Tax=Sphingobium sp. CR2-8 TaxID=1306534 RepID=UPI002DBC0BEF|nr:amidohydrolase family protein [Sphingobium sp. CR2-8]MEC3909502.1 amidohydrolase family protein [Sphingobium sp. CR2-8]
MYDLVIRGARIIDGTNKPAFEANLAVKNGRIAYVGTDDVDGEQVIEARGRYLTPGFVDTHTHYDAQVTWDPWLRPHSMHGVTSYVCGNCGFGLSPVSKDSLKYLVPMLAKVEGIPYKSLVQGARINWESTAEMFEQLTGNVGVNVGFMVGHSTLRVNAMRERAQDSESTRADIDAMKAQLRQSLDEGALGFSSSHIETHVDHDGEEVPSLHSPHEELLELMSVVKDYEGTMTGYVLTGMKPDAQQMRRMAEVSLASGRPYAWPLLIPGLHAPDMMDAKMACTDVAREMGAELRVQAPSCPVGVYINFKNGLGFDMFPGVWKDVYRKDHAGRVAAFADPVMRQQLEEDAKKLPEGANGQYRAKFDNYLVQGVKAAENEKYVGRMMGEIGKEEGRTAFQAIMDMIVKDDLQTVFVPNDPDADELAIWKDIVRCMRDSRTIWGGDDGGAHLDVLEAYSHGTRFIQYAVKEHGLMPIEEAVHYFTQSPAQFMGLKDRGVIAVGKYADLNIIDFERVAVQPVEFRSDFPADGERLYTGAEGFDYVIVNGVPIIAEGNYTWAKPGKILKAREDTYTVDMAKGAAITESQPMLEAAE